MRPCDTQFSFLLNYISRRINSRHSSTCLTWQQILKDYAIQEINLLLWFAFFGITALLIRKLFFLCKIWVYACPIPGPPSPSFYGPSSLFSTANPHLHLTELLVKSPKKYGTIVKLWLSPTQLLVSIKEPSLVNGMLSKAGDKMPLVGRVYRLAFGQSRFFVSSFEKLLEKAIMMRDRVVDSVMEKIAGIIEKGTLDCGIFSQHMAFSILGTTLFGDTFFAWSKASAYEELILGIAKDACFWASYTVPPFWKRGYWKYQYLCTKLKSLTEDVVQHCQLNNLLSKSNDHDNSEMTVAKAVSNMNKISEEKLEKPHSKESSCPFILKEEPYGNVMGMMFHGCVTTADLISNILARFGMHPDIQEKIYSEIIMVQKGHNKLSKPDVSKMHLLLATVYESARLLPAGPLLQRCSSKHDVSEVPVNSGARSYILNDPCKNAAFLIFGSGLRACAGQRFAVFGIASLLASLLDLYEIQLVPEYDIEPRALMVNCVLQLVPSPKIVFVRRIA